MKKQTYQNLLTEREATIIFNKGLQCVIYVLESIGPLSPDEIKFMVAELKKQIAESQIRYTGYLFEYVS